MLVRAYNSRVVRRALIAAIAVVLGGCVDSGGFYVVPEHKDLGVGEHTNDVVVAEFKIVNSLHEPVTITDIYPSCRCTTVELLRNPIPPGTTTLLRVAANLSGMAGRQRLSVFFTTDNPDFPGKRLSFDVFAPATTDSQRRFVPIGKFHPGDTVYLELPTESFSRGSIELVNGSSDDNVSLVAEVNKQLRGISVLVIKGLAPRAVGAFSKTLQLRETLTEDDVLQETMIELQLGGHVLARWDVASELYLGFMALGGQGSNSCVTITIERAMLGPTDEGKRPVSISVTPTDGWLSLKHTSISDTVISIIFQVHEDELTQYGAVQSALELAIEHDDGTHESYDTTIFVHIEK